MKEGKFFVIILGFVFVFFFLLLGGILENDFNSLASYFKNLSIATLTITVTYLVYLFEIENKSKEKLKFFQSKLYNLLFELNSNIDIPQQYSYYFKSVIFKDLHQKKFNHILKNLDPSDSVSFFDKYLEYCLFESRREDEKFSKYDLYNNILSEDLIKKRPIVAIEIEQKILDSVISDLEFYDSRFEKLRTYLGEVKHSCQVASTSQKILLYNSGDEGYLKNSVLNALIIQMHYSDLFRKRIKKLVEEIKKINKNVDLNKFDNLKKEFIS
jgi:hypothetical protein